VSKSSILRDHKRSTSLRPKLVAHLLDLRRLRESQIANLTATLKAVLSWSLTFFVAKLVRVPFTAGCRRRSARKRKFPSAKENAIAVMTTATALQSS